MANVGIIGRARVGKDTAGQWLVDNRGYRRVSFADPLKEAALRLDPIVMHDSWVDHEGDRQEHWEDTRLSDVVSDEGWEVAKSYPEVRRILQELGMAVREIDPEFWLRQALAKVTEANDGGTPVVITDVRFPNEVASLRRAGFHLVYVDRPGVPRLDHESEGALTMEDADYVLPNTTDVPSFLKLVEATVGDIYAVESRRHANRVW